MLVTHDEVKADEQLAAMLWDSVGLFVLTSFTR